MTSLPELIPLNIIDRSYLIAETEQDNGAYFPMSIVTVVKLKSRSTQKAIVAALQTLVNQYPNLRLAYALDIVNRAWVRLSHEQLPEHLAACVQELPATQSIEDAVSEIIRANNSSLSQPLNVMLLGDYLIFRMHHSFGDGKFFFLILQYLLAELQGKEVDRLPLSNRWWIPLWHVIWQNIGQGTQVMWQFVKSSFAYYQDFQHDTMADSENFERSPIKTGSPMSVIFKTIDPECLSLLHDMKREITINTLLQVIISEKLRQLGLINDPITYTILVDLRRYLKESSLYHPGNLASQIRITLDTQGSFSQRCTALQKQIRTQLQLKMPLASIPGEWLLALGGDKTYQSVNRDWLLKSTHNDPRFFVLTNLGNLDTVFDPVSDVLSDSFDPQLIVPLMGGPPLVFSFNTKGDHGNVAITYDPQLLSRTQIESVLEVFDLPFLKKLAQELLSSDEFLV